MTTPTTPAADKDKQDASACTGSCFCGQVRYQFTRDIGHFQYCHCSRCRKVTGSAHSAHILVRREDFRWTQGEEQVGTYIPPDTKYFSTAFCRRCGSTLPWLSKNGKTMVITAGTLDDTPALRPMHNFFCASRPAWYAAASALPEYDEFPPKK